MFGSTPLTDQQRMNWAMLVAIAVHIVIALAVGFRLYSPPPPQPVFSLNLALFQRAGGAERDRLAGAVLPSSPGAEELENTQINTQQAIQQRLYVPAQAATPAATIGEATELAQEPKQTATEQALTTAPETTPSAIGQPNSSRRSKIIRSEDHTTPEGFYAEQWRLHVQRMGNRYFHNEAKAGKLTGRLTLDVAVRSDGTLLSIALLKSSGSAALDNVARRIVMLASPFKPFPEPLRRQYDILHIVRTWEFDQGNRLRSER